MKPALMIIDMQKEYFVGTAKDSMTKASEYINEAIDYFRNKKLPIIWIQDIDKDCEVIPGSEKFELIDLLKVKDNEIKIYKEYENSFNKTDCEKILKEDDIDFIVLAGYCAEHCILSTYRGALDLYFTPVLLKYGISSGDKENLKFVEKISSTIDYKILNKLLENTNK